MTPKQLENTVFCYAATPNFEKMADQMIESSGLNKSNWTRFICDKKEGNWGTENFNRLGFLRIEQILDYLESGFNVFVSDVDVHWITPIPKIQMNADLCAQLDPDTGFCLGAIFYTPNDWIMEILRRCLDEKEKWIEANANDQIAFNGYYRQASQDHGKIFTYDFLQVESWGTIRACNDLWNGQEFDLPESLDGFHANYTIGLKNKTKLLNDVREKHIPEKRKN